MMYLGELLSGRLLTKLNKTMLIVGVLFGLTVGALGISAIMERSKISSMKTEIDIKGKAISAAQLAAREAREKPAREKIPTGLAAVGAFQTRLNKLAIDNKCALTQFQASDQMNPFVSTFAGAGGASGTWMQVEVKMNLQGTTQAVMETLKDLNTIGIPYEFTSVEISRTQASETGQATISSNVSLRVLTIPGGA